MKTPQSISCIISSSIAALIGLGLLIAASFIIKQTAYLRDFDTQVRSLSVFSIIIGILVILFALQLIYVVFRQFPALTALLSGLLIFATILAGLCCMILAIDENNLQSKYELTMENLLRNYSDANNIVNSKLIVERIQQTFQCCGNEKATDWKIYDANGVDTPDSCCRQMTVGCGKGALAKEMNIYLRGCIEPISGHFRQKYYLLILMNFFVMVTSLVSAIFGFIFERFIRDQYQLM